MFEYLMPALVMHEPRFSLLDQTNRRAVQKQIRLRRASWVAVGHLRIGLQHRDREYTYQYASFGLPSSA